MAMSVTVTTNNVRRLKKFSMAIVSASDGTASGSVDVGACRINRVNVVNGTGGNAPSNAWDFTLSDADGVDILGAGGGNIAVPGNVALQPKLDATPVVAEGGYVLVNGTLTLACTNMGDTKQATLHIYGEEIR